MFQKYPFVSQNGIKDCAGASLLMIVKYYGGFINIDELSLMLQTDKSGTTALSIIDTAKKLGFDAKGIKTGIDSINNENIILPCIAHVVINKSYKHYVVIYKIDFKRKILIVADPQNKIKKMSFNDFNDIWSGVLLIMYPIKPILFNKDCSILDFCWCLIKEQSKDIRSLLFISILVNLFSIGSSFYFKYIIGGIDHSRSYLFLILFIFILIYFVKNLTEFFRNKILIHLNQKLDAKLSIDSFRNVLLLPYHYYHNRTTGEIISRINDLNKVREMISKVALTLFIDLPLTIFASVFLYFISSTLFFISLIILLLYILIVLFYRDILNSEIDNVLNEKANSNSLMVESIGGIETVKGLNLEKYIGKKFEYSYVKYLKSMFNLDNIYANQLFFKDLIETFGQLFIIFVGVLLVVKNEMTIGSLLTFNAILLYFLSPIKSIINLDYVIKESKNVIKKMLNMFIKDKKDGKIFTFQNGDIRFNHLFFSLSYKDILKDVNLFIRKGNKVIITGNSGSGKSTLLKILMQYYEVKRDSLYIGNIDINDYSEVRNNICYISQQEMLFTDTLYNNVMLDNDDEKKFLKIKDICCLNDFLGNIGFNMLLEENGSNVSGGQKQRIVLARALMCSFDILLIDEGLSQIDVSLERKILKNIFKFYKDKTIIIISHRLENMDLYNQLIEISNGRVKRNVMRNG